MSEQVINHLLQSDEPSIRFKMRANVLGEDRSSAAMLQLQQDIKSSARVQTLLHHAHENLSAGRHVYHKWQGLHWMMAALAELEYPAGDLELIPFKDELLRVWLDPYFYRDFEADTKAKAYAKDSVPVMQGRHRRCAAQQGNVLFTLLKLGLNDERIDALTERLLHWQWPDGGWNCDKNPDARHSSFMETLIPLRGLVLYAGVTDSAIAKIAVVKAAEVFLKRRLYKSQRTGAIIHPEFVQLHYPLYWHYDFLCGLKVIAEAGFIDDPRCVDALDLLESKQLKQGGWPAEKRYHTVSANRKHGADYVGWGGTGKNKMNEWVTADALFVLTKAGRL